MSSNPQLGPVGGGPSPAAAGSVPTTDTGATVDAVARAVLEVPGVTELHGGVLGEVATYLPSRRVNGIRLQDDGCEVHVVLAWDTPVMATADAIRTRLESLVDGPVQIVVEDIAPPDTHPSPQP